MSKIYSRLEFSWMLRFQYLKDAAFSPIVFLLRACRLSADVVSLASGVVVIASLILALLTDQPIAFVIGYWIHICLDGLDGALARASGTTPSIHGLAMDLVMDSCGIISLGLFVLFAHLVSLWSGVLFILLYLTVNAISFQFAISNREYDFIFRPRLLAITGLTIDIVSASSLTSAVITFSNGLLVFFATIGIMKLLRS